MAARWETPLFLVITGGYSKIPVLPWTVHVGEHLFLGARCGFPSSKRTIGHRSTSEEGAEVGNRAQRAGLGVHGRSFPEDSFQCYSWSLPQSEGKCIGWEQPLSIALFAFGSLLLLWALHLVMIWVGSRGEPLQESASQVTLEIGQLPGLGTASM